MASALRDWVPVWFRHSLAVGTEPSPLGPGWLSGGNERSFCAKRPRVGVCPWSFVAGGNAQELGPFGGVSQSLGGAGIPAPHGDMGTGCCNTLRRCSASRCRPGGGGRSSGARPLRGARSCAFCHELSSLPHPVLHTAGFLSLCLLAQTPASPRAVSPSPGLPWWGTEKRLAARLPRAGRAPPPASAAALRPRQGLGLPSSPPEGAGSRVKCACHTDVHE